MTIRLRSERHGRLRERATIDAFEDLLVGVPEAHGGDGQAPDPHDYFDLSLGACKAITARMYAQRKGWPLEGIEVTVRRDERDEAHGVYRLEVIMRFEGELDDTQCQRLEQVSDKCPIHRLMTSSEVTITTRQAH